MITISRINRRQYKFICSTAKEERVIQSILSFEDEGFFYAESFKEGHWDGIYRLYNANNEFSVGLLEFVSEGLRREEYDFKVIEKDFFEHINFSQLDLNPALYKHQREAVTNFIKKNYGILMVPTRGGKTFIACEISRLLLMNQPDEDIKILFFVDTIDLLEQATEDFAEYFDVEVSDIGRIHGDSFDIHKPIVVSTIQTSINIYYSNDAKKRNTFRKYLKSLNCLLVDEIHEFSSGKRQKVLLSAKNVNYFLGMSATPFRSQTPLDNLTIKQCFGDICYEITERDLIKAGVLSDYKVMLFNFESEYSSQITSMVRSYRKNDEKRKIYSYLQNELIFKNQSRDEYVHGIIKVLLSLNLKVLVLFSSVKHGDSFAKRTGYKFISGRDNRKTRAKERLDFLDDEGGVLLASNIYKKGITLPQVEVMINMDDGLELSNIIQRKGRVLGITDTKKKSLVIDIVDDEANYFSEHSLQRLELYEWAVGEDKMNLFDCSDPNSLNDFKNEVAIWFDKKK